MRMSVHEQLEADVLAARRARLDAERKQRELGLIRCELASLRLDLALLKLQRVPERKYRPDQPRVPAGSSDGGQWTSEGVGSSRPRDESAFRVAQGDRLQGYSVDLREEEMRGGHTIERHVGKSPERLLDRMRQEQDAAVQNRNLAFGLVAGSFPSVDSATRLVNSTLAKNPGTVQSVATGTSPHATIDQQFDSPTGYEAYAATEHSQPYIRETYGVSVHIRHDRLSPRGFRVLTAFPKTLKR